MAFEISDDDIVDTDDQQARFEALVNGRREARVFLIRDERVGAGKSTLLRKLIFNCQYRLEQRPVLCRINLEDNADPNEFRLIQELAGQILTEAVYRGGDYLPTYSRLEAALAEKNLAPFLTRDATPRGGTHGVVDASGLVAHDQAQVAGLIINTGDGAKIDLATLLRPAAPEWSEAMRPAAQRQVTEAFFTDLRSLGEGQLVVIFIDSVDEKAGSPSLVNWVRLYLLEKVFLDPVRRPRNAILCLAGRSLPDYRKRLQDDFEMLVEAPRLLSDWQQHHSEALLSLVLKRQLAPSVVQAFHDAVVQRAVPLGRALDGAILLG